MSKHSLSSLEAGPGEGFAANSLSWAPFCNHQPEKKDDAEFADRHREWSECSFQEK
jgi:hypothetical protein